MGFERRLWSGSVRPTMVIDTSPDVLPFSTDWPAASESPTDMTLKVDVSTAGSR